MSWRRTRFIVLAVVVAATGLVFLLSGENEPIYKGHRLSWWVDRYGGSMLPYDKPGATEALSAIGTNSLAYLMNWIRKADEQRSPARHCVTSVLKHFPKPVVPSFLARWAVENEPYFKINSAQAATVLLKCLEDDDPFIRKQAGPDALVAVPFLMARYRNSDINISLEASNALMQIAPEVLSNKSPP